jgi:hypothetical protein
LIQKNKNKNKMKLVNKLHFNRQQKQKKKFKTALKVRNNETLNKQYLPNESDLDGEIKSVEDINNENEW